MKNEAILVTGASGFIGTHLVAALKKKGGHEIYQHSIADGDIASCSLDFVGVRHVFHLAGKTYVPDSWKCPRDYYEANVLGTANVLEFCRRNRASITVISSYVYGKPQSLPIREDHKLQPLNPYAHSKILAEEISNYYRAQFEIGVNIVRPFNVYGPGQTGPFLIPVLIRQALDPSAEWISVADLRPRRDYLHVRDLISLLLATTNCAEGSVFNAGSGRSFSIQELVDSINRLIPLPKPVVSREEFRQEEVLDVVADISRAGIMLNWRPQIGLDEGLKETLVWMKCLNEAD